jgi:hypothetical protein
MGFKQKIPDGRLIRDGCGTETYFRQSTGSSSTLCALVCVHRQRNTGVCFEPSLATHSQDCQALCVLLAPSLAPSYVSRRAL